MKPANVEKKNGIWIKLSRALGILFLCSTEAVGQKAV